MRLTTFANASLPNLAWVAGVDRAGGTVILLHGPWVEVRQNFFIEGVWNGPFQAGGFGETDSVFGTGGILSDDSIRFVTTASTTDSLYYHENDTRLTVSNSLPLILGYIEDALDVRCSDYPAICDSIMKGINDYRRDIPTVRGRLRRLMYRNLDVSKGGIRESEKSMPPRLKCFEDYQNYLQNNYKLMAANARDSARARPLQILSTQSSGFDSTAVNAIAAPYGVDKVFTISKGKSSRYLAHDDDGKAPDDDGSQICESLGLDCIRIDRRAFVQGFDHEYLYYCALHHNQDANLLEIANHVANPSLLLTGTGGAVWRDPAVKRTKRGDADSQLKRSDSSGLGMAEVRLVVGFIQLPLPDLAVRREQEIDSITMSPEMDPWRLGTMYDKPIARRIAEEAGVPRKMFGQSKKGSVVIFSHPAIPYGKVLRDQFLDYLADHKIMTRSKTRLWPAVRWVNSMLLVKSKRRFAVVYYAERVIAKLIGREFRFKPMWRQAEGLLFCFCVNKTAKLYADQLDVAATQRSAGSRETAGQEGRAS